MSDFKFLPKLYFNRITLPLFKYDIRLLHTTLWDNGLSARPIIGSRIQIIRSNAFLDVITNRII